MYYKIQFAISWCNRDKLFDFLLNKSSEYACCFFIKFHNIINHFPREGPGGLSRECILRIPSVIVKGD